MSNNLALVNYQSYCLWIVRLQYDLPSYSGKFLVGTSEMFYWMCPVFLYLSFVILKEAYRSQSATNQIHILRKFLYLGFPLRSLYTG